MSANQKRKTYCVWDNTDDALIALDETADRCAELMGISRLTFYNYVTRPKDTWTVIPSDKIEGSIEDE